MNSVPRGSARCASPVDRRWRRHRLAALVAALGCGAVPAGHATTKTLDCASTAWTSATCWNPDGVPVAGDAVQVRPVGTSTTTLSITTGTTAVASTLDVDSTTGTLAQVSLSGGSLTLGSTYMVGVSGSGVAAQTGGALSAASLQIGPYAGSSGSYTFSGAASTMALSQLYVGVRGNGSLVMGGGTATVGSQFIVGYFDTVGSATVLQNGGTVTAPTSYIGVDGNASFEQAAGVHGVGGTLYLAYGPGGHGSYTLNGGTLSSSTTYVGRAGNASFVQRGGSHSVTNALVLGQLMGSSGSYTLAGGLLSVGSLTRGEGSVGFSWSAGILELGTALAIQPGQVFSSFLSVGAGMELRAPAVNVAGSSTLNVAGGRLQAQTVANRGRTTLSAGVLELATLLDNTGTLTLAGGSLSGNANLNNAGSVLGAGGIAIGGAFTQTGLIQPEGGTLSVDARAGFTNAGYVRLLPGSRLSVAERWSNAGQVELGGGALAGGQVDNGSTGSISGFGLIDAPLNNAGLLSVAGGALTVTGSLGNTGIVQLGGTGTQLAGAGQLTNNGTVQGAGHVGLRVANAGTLEAIGGTLSFGAAGNTNTASGTLAAGTGAKLLMTQGLASNAGLIQLDGGTFDNAGAALANSGRILGHGTLRAGTLTNTNQLAFSFGDSSVAAPIANQAGAKLIVSNGAQASFAAAVANAGELRVSSGGAANFFGLVSGAGSFTGGGQARFEGGFSPGASPALVTIAFDVFYGSDSPILMELGGTTPGACDTCADKIVFNGAVTLEGGPLNVVWWNGYAGQAGDRFDLFDFNGGLSGRFGSVNLPALDPGLRWQTDALYSDGVLSVAAVPEPGTWVLMLLGGGALLGWRRRRG